MDAYPDWWEWELELNPHVLKRMIDRNFNEADLRAMIADAHTVRPDHVEGRFALLANHDGRPWCAIVEPDYDLELLVVVTAYPVS